MSQTIRWPQYTAGLSAAGGAFIVGIALGWSSPAAPRLVDEGQYFPMTLAQFDWIASVLVLGCAISCLLIGYLLKKFGRKWVMLSLVVPFVIGWALVIWAQNFVMLLIGRFFIGLAGGAFFVSAPQYSAEIAEKDIRGRIGSFFSISVESGILFVYLIGPQMRLVWTNVICGSIPLVFGAIFFFMPESPVYLVMENRDEEAKKSYKWLRGEFYDPQPEVDELKQTLIKNGTEKTSLKQAFKDRASIRATIISTGLMFFQQASGINIVLFYSTIIFNAADTGIDSDLSTIIIGSVPFAATITCLALVDRVGRKILLLISITSMTVMLTSLGVFFYLQDNYPETAKSLGWLPLTSLCLYIISFSLGFGCIPWMMMIEVLPKEITPVVSSVLGAFNWLLAFIITATFNSIADVIGIGQTFWIFASLSLTGIIFVLVVVPETKGKSMIDIQRMLSGEKMVS